MKSIFLQRGSRPLEGTSRAEESGGEKKDEKENQLKRTKSRELRGGVMYYSCHCIKRNGLQHDCRRTGCGGEPACLHLPDPLCAPSQLARARGLADPAPLEAHLRAQGGGGGSGAGGSESRGGGSGKRFIVCELKGISPDISADKSGKCCKCSYSAPKSVPTQGPGPSGAKVGACILPHVPNLKPTSASGADKKCPCSKGLTSPDMQEEMFVFDEKTINKILSSFENKDAAKDKDDVVIGPGGRPRKVIKAVVKEPCTRAGCVHWQPPPPCCWDAPCKADCFETPPGIHPGRNPLKGAGGGGGSGNNATKQGREQPPKMVLLTIERCTS